MNLSKNNLLCVAVVVMALPSALYAKPEAAGPKLLDAKAKGTQKLEVNVGFGGPRNTLIFYTFPEQNAVLKVVIDNKSKKFPVSATLYAFGDDVTAAELKKWLNNQHSDALFPGIPEPATTKKISAEACQSLSHKFIDKTTARFGEFENYSVSFKLSGVKPVGKLRLKDFSDKATVHLKVD